MSHVRQRPPVVLAVNAGLSKSSSFILSFPPLKYNHMMCILSYDTDKWSDPIANGSLWRFENALRRPLVRDEMF